MNVNELIGVITKAKKGDKQALAELYAKSYSDIYYFALSTVKDPGIAEDILQEVAIEMINDIGDLKDPASYKSWIFTVTFRRCNKYFKKTKEELISEDDMDNDFFESIANENLAFHPDAELDNEEFKSTIYEMINALSEEQRAATLMYYFSEMSVREIASVQAVSEGTVKSRLNYARKALKKSVEKYEEKYEMRLSGHGMQERFAFWLWWSFKEMSLSSKKLADVAYRNLVEVDGVKVA